jgi:hypothetical protein
MKRNSWNFIKWQHYQFHESWTNKVRHINKIQSVEKRYLRIVKGCTRPEHIGIKNEDNRKELRIQSLKIK